MKKLLILTISLSSLLSFGQSEDIKSLGLVIDSVDLRRNLSVLASDEYEGRETGMEGQRKAAAYIANHFQKLGLIPAGDNNTYLQNFPITIEKPGFSELYLGGKKFNFIEDFFFTGNYGDVKIDFDQVVFAGYGIENSNYNDYAKLDVKDKILLILDGEPKDKDGISLLKGDDANSWTMDRNKKYNHAKEKGAKGVLMAVNDYDKRVAMFKSYILNAKVRLVKDKPTDTKKGAVNLYISDRAANSLLNSLEVTVDQIIKKGKKHTAVGKTIDSKGSITLGNAVSQGSSSNVLGYIKGTDLSQEALVISAHYDHIGKDGDIIFNGADDDGSGTVSIMEIAEAFSVASKNGNPPRRSVLFLAVSGEEKGLLGSEYYTEHPFFEMENTVTDLNIDMVGRLDKEHANNPNYVYIIGSNMLSDTLHNISEEMNRKYTGIDLDYTYNSVDDPNKYYYRSDHYNFAKNNVPVIFYFNGVHEDYHQEGDEVEKINFSKIEKISRLVFYTAWEVANRNERPKLKL